MGGLKIVNSKSGAGTKIVLMATKQVVRVTTLASVPAGTQTQIAGYTLVNESTCTANGPGKGTVKKPPLNGTITTGSEVATRADGSCPGVDFTFATISYTSTVAGAKTDRLVANWSQVYQKVNYITVDTFKLKITK